jgi:hypothetical protein
MRDQWVVSVRQEGSRNQPARVELAGVGRQVRHERQALRNVRRLVRHTPDDDARPVAVAQHQLAQLIAGASQHIYVPELDVPVNGDFLPEKQAHPVGQARCVFVVGVVSEAQEVTSQLAGRLQHLESVLLAGRSPSTRELLVGGDAS